MLAVLPAELHLTAVSDGVCRARSGRVHAGPRCAAWGCRGRAALAALWVPQGSQAVAVEAGGDGAHLADICIV